MEFLASYEFQPLSFDIAYYTVRIEDMDEINLGKVRSCASLFDHYAMLSTSLR